MLRQYTGIKSFEPGVKSQTMGHTCTVERKITEWSRLGRLLKESYNWKTCGTEIYRILPLNMVHLHVPNMKFTPPHFLYNF